MSCSSAPPTSPRLFAVIPAAGRSRRMGAAKLLLPWGDGRTTLIEAVLAAWRRTRATHTVVTVHPDDVRLAEMCRAAGAEVVVPAQPPRDMKASIVAALDYLRRRYAPSDARGDAWLVAPADVPRLSAAVVERLAAAAVTHPTTIVRPVHAECGGHPLWLPWSAAEAVAVLDDDEGIDALRRRLPSVDIPAGPECLADDIDTPDDYHRLRNRND